MRFLLAAIALAAIPAAAAQQPSSSVIALTNVIVIDGTGAAPVSGMTVLIDGPRIADVFPTGTKPLPRGAAVRDLSGHTVIPGLIDAHVHLVPLLASGRADAELRRMLRAGIVAVREMAGAQATQAIRARIGAGELDGPDVYSSFVMAGPQFMALDPRVAGRGRAGGGEAGRGRGAGPGAGMAAGTVSSEADVPVVTMRAVDSGASAVKFYAELSPSLMRSLSAAARERGLKVWGIPRCIPRGRWRQRVPASMVSRTPADSSGRILTSTPLHMLRSI